MGNKILTNSIVDPNAQQPFTGPSLAFLQDWNANALSAFFRALIGDGNYGPGAYAMAGMRNTGSGANVIIGSGFIVFDGELYACNNYTDTLTGSNVVIATVTVAYDLTIDPVMFTDLVPRNVHQVKTIVLSQGLTGTGDFDYLDMSFVQATVVTKTVDIGDWNMDSASSKSVALGITSSKIRGITGFVRNDADNAYYPIPYNDATPTLQVWAAGFGSGSITLLRLTGGFFDGVNFDSTSYNRGWINVTYEL